MTNQATHTSEYPISIVENSTTLWDLLNYAFKWDGSWRDVYVLNTTEADWVAVLNAIANSPYPSSFTVNGVENPDIPRKWSTVMPKTDGPRSTFHLSINGITANTYFFVEDYIEFDIDPRAAKEPNVPDLCRFMLLLSKATGKPCVLTDENWVSVGRDTMPYLTIDAEQGVLSV